MSVNIPGFYAKQFASNVSLLLQQKGSKLRGAVTPGSYVGSAAQVVDQIGAIEAALVTTRFAPMPRTDAPVDSRWVNPSDYDCNQLLDTYDRLRLLLDPTSAYCVNATYALGRKIDDIIIAAMFGSAYTGVAGTTATVFGTGQVVPVNTGGTDSGMNVSKLRFAKKLLMAAEVDLDNDPLYCAITAKEHDELLNEIQVISLDFNEKPVMMSGKVQQFLGINFIHCERLVAQAAGTDDQSGSSTQIPLWVKSGMHLGIWDDVNVAISQRNDLQSVPFQAYAKMTMGATRVEENKIVKIWCQV